MKSLWLLTKKNLQLLIRSRFSALIIIFAPLLLILILGLSYDTTSQFSLNIGVYAPSFSEEIESFMNLLQEKEFNIIRYESSLKKCEEDLQAGIVHTCISLPESLQVESNQQKEVTFLVDPSRVNIVWMIQETVQSKFNLKSQEISQQLSQNILSTLSETKSVLDTGKLSLGSTKERSSATIISAKSTLTSLNSIIIEIPAVEYNTSSVEIAKEKIGDSQEQVFDAINLINDLNMSGSDKIGIIDVLNQANSNLDGAGDLFQNGTGTIPSIIAALQQELEQTKTSLTSAAEAIGSTKVQLGEMTSVLEEIANSVDTVQSSLDGAIVKIDSQSVTDSKIISSPIVAKIERVGEEGTYLNYLFPSLIILVIMFGSLLLGTTLVMIEKNSPAFIRNFFVPVKKITFVVSTYLTNLVLIVAQIVIILIIALFFLDNLASALPAVALVLFLAASVFTFLGMVIGYIFASEETGILASISLGSLMLSLSGLLLPLEGVTPLLREFTFFNPFVISDKLIRQFLLFDASFSLVWPDLLILVGYVLILFFVILAIESFLHQHLIKRFMKHHRKVHQKAKV